MKNKQHIDREVDKTMQALDDMKPATTDPFFYSRLQAKLEHRNEPEYNRWSLNWDFGFAFTIALVLLFVSLNFIVLTEYPHVYESETTNRQVFMDELAADYQVIDLSYFESTEE